MKNYSLFILLFCSFLLLNSCNSDDGPALDEPLVEYFDSFRAEAAKRGIDFDHVTANISATIGDINSSTVIGQCVRNPDNTNAIVIDRSFWGGFDDWERELVVYHELGHCFLNRGHEDTINPDGTCFSIMHSSEDLCDNNYNALTRDEFLDELFR